VKELLALEMFTVAVPPAATDEVTEAIEEARGIDTSDHDFEMLPPEHPPAGAIVKLPEIATVLLPSLLWAISPVHVASVTTFPFRISIARFLFTRCTPFTLSFALFLEAVRLYAPLEDPSGL